MAAQFPVLFRCTDRVQLDANSGAEQAAVADRAGRLELSEDADHRARQSGRLRVRSQGGQPPYLHPDYGSTVKRAPKYAPIRLEQTLTEITGPVFAGGWAGDDLVDLTQGHGGPPLGERIIVAGRVLDEDARPVADTLVELWQCNAAGRYRHPVDQHDAPLDPNFDGVGQAVTNARGRYRFVTIKPGAYPWRNSPNAWRPAHLHFGVFGGGFVTRLITQMYFPGDPAAAI